MTGSRPGRCRRRSFRRSRPGSGGRSNDVDLLRAAGFSDATALVSAHRRARRRSAPTPSSTTTSRTTGRTCRPSPVEERRRDARPSGRRRDERLRERARPLQPGLLAGRASRSPTSSRSPARRERSVRSRSTSGRASRRSSRASSTRSGRSVSRSGRGAPHRTPARSPSSSRRSRATRVQGLAGAKTAAAGTGTCEGKGSFGLFYPAVPAASGAVVEAVVDGLQQTATTRSNLALFNPSADGAGHGPVRGLRRRDRREGVHLDADRPAAFRLDAGRPGPPRRGDHRRLRPHPARLGGRRLRGVRRPQRRGEPGRANGRRELRGRGPVLPAGLKRFRRGRRRAAWAGRSRR